MTPAARRIATANSLDAHLVPVCERDGCESTGRTYLIVGGVVHTYEPAVSVAIGSHRTSGGWITLCTDHAMTDLGVAIP